MEKNWFLIFSEELAQSFTKMLTWLGKHHRPIVISILSICLIGVVTRSITLHYIDKLEVGSSVSVALYQVLVYSLIVILWGLLALSAFCVITAIVVTIGRCRNTKEQKIDNENSQSPQAAEPEQIIVPLPEIREEIIRAYLTKRFMAKQIDESGKTMLDETISKIASIRLLYRKGSRSAANFNDKHIAEVAEILFSSKYMDTLKNDYSDWCRSLFIAMGLDEPLDVKKYPIEKKIQNMFSFLTEEQKNV